MFRTLSASSSDYRRDIDGLRAISILAVVLYHAGVSTLPGGFVGVDVFFVISGYLIIGHVVTRAEVRSFRLDDFYARRARRILPALLLITSVTVLLGLALLTSSEMRELTSSAALSLLGLSNLYFWKAENYFTPEAWRRPFLMTWSLGVEEQFYAFAPLLALCASRLRPFHTRLLLGGLVAISLLASAYATVRMPHAAFYLLPSRAWEVACGGLLAITATHLPRLDPGRRGVWANVRSVAGIVLVIGACVRFDSATSFPGLAALVPTAGALLMLSAPQAWLNRAVLASTPAVFTGRISYSLYLWHWPLFSLLRICTAGQPAPGAVAAAAGVSYGLAVLTWRWVEMPFRTRSLPTRTALSRYGVALGAFCSVCALLLVSHGFAVLRLPRSAQAVERLAAEGAGDDCLAAFGQGMSSLPARCLGASPSQPPNVVVVGDSHAAALAPGLRERLRAEGAGLAVLAKSTCLPLLDYSVSRLQQPENVADCAKFMQDAAMFISKTPSVREVIVTADWTLPFETPGERLVSAGGTALNQTAMLREGLDSFLQRVNGNSRCVILASDVPTLAFDPIAEAVGGEMPVRRALRQLESDGAPSLSKRPLIQTSASVAPVADLLVQAARSRPGALFVDLAPAICPFERCRVSEGGLPLYVDRSHLSLVGSRLVSERLPRCPKLPNTTPPSATASSAKRSPR